MKLCTRHFPFEIGYVNMPFVPSDAGSNSVHEVAHCTDMLRCPLMRTPPDVYAEYRTMPGLQIHQLRVAAVGKLICEHFREPIDARSVILACLFHDMGNIIKSDLAVFPEFLAPHPRSYWEEVQREYIERYGDAAHEATISIMREMRLPDDAIALADGVGFSRLAFVRDTSSFEQKVVEYSDLRAGPHGILPMEERLAESRARYRGRRSWADEGGKDDFARLADAARDIESQLFAQCSIRPEEITDEKIAPIVADLKRYQV